MDGVTVYEISDVRGRPAVCAWLIADEKGGWGCTFPPGADARRVLTLGHVLGFHEAKCGDRESRFPGSSPALRVTLEAGDFALTNTLVIPGVSFDEALGHTFSDLYRMSRDGPRRGRGIDASGLDR